VKQDLTELVQAISERQQATDRQLSELSALVKALEARIAEFARPASAIAHAPAAPAKAAQATPARAKVTPEVLVLLAAAASAYLGKEVRIRSARKLFSHSEGLSPWAQQGRAFIQASHNAHFSR
jgi:hypothetical protein